MASRRAVRPPESHSDSAVLMRSVCISDGDTVNERKVEVEKGENEGIE